MPRIYNLQRTNLKKTKNNKSEKVEIIKFKQLYIRYKKKL